MTCIFKEEAFDQKIQEILPALEEYKSYDLIIGIPFYNEREQLPLLLESVDQVLSTWMGKRQLIVCVGDPAAGDMTPVIQGLSLKHPCLALVMPEEYHGRGASIRAIIEISKRLEADLLIFSAKMSTSKGPGIEGGWLDSLLTPIQGRYDMVIGSMRGRIGIDSIAHMLVSPMLEVFYGFKITDPLGGIYALSHDFIEDLAHEALFWSEVIHGHGIDFWLLSRALCWNKNICEVNMDGVIKPYNLEARNRVFRDTARAVFEAIHRDSAIWMQDKLVIKVADTLAYNQTRATDILDHSLSELLQRYYEGCSQFRHLFEKGSFATELNATLGQEELYIGDTLWVNLLFEFMIDYCFGEAEERGDLLEALTCLYNGKVASYILEIKDIENRVQPLFPEQHDQILVSKMEVIRYQLIEAFRKKKNEFIKQWLNSKEQARPPIIPLGYMEYVPGKPIVIPKKLLGKDRRVVQTDNIFKSLRKKYQDRFNQFVSEGLRLEADALPDKVTAAMEAFMDELEAALERIFPGDLHTCDGLRQFAGKIFELVPLPRIFTLNAEIIREMLVRFPPVNLMIPLGYYRPEKLIEKMDPRDAVTYANLIEDRSYTDRDLAWLADTLKPESFEWIDLKFFILPEDIHMGILSRGKISSSNIITGRMSIKSLEPNTGGKYPRLRYFTSIMRRLAVAEHYSDLFQQNVLERKNIGVKLRNSMLGLHKGEDFSAHNIFENYHHRSLVNKIRVLAGEVEAQGHTRESRLFRLMADGYGVSQVLEDGKFLTCTSWSWASYSFKGGLKIPGPWTTTVEARWFNHDFLEAMYRELGYDVDYIMQLVFRFIQSNRSNQNLLDTLLPTRPKDVTVVVQEATDQPSKHLQRYHGNPVMEPLENSAWESRYVLNPGALRLKDRVYLFYRAVGEDNISHIGLAITDGYQVLERLPEPIFSPETPEEKMGCEDPRLIVIEDKIFMLYTAYDGNLAQIAAASITVEDFIAGRYKAWKREGLAFKNIWDKDAILFPERINGKYVIYHRIEPSIWVTYMKEIKFPLKEKHAIILGPRPGRMWDSLKIGAGAQPLKTQYGWLLIYHGVDYNYVYSLGVILVDLNNPQKVLYRSPNPILQPEEDYEIGLNGAWVPNVVFTCGAVGATDKEVLEDEDKILVYYGAADTSIGVATATLADLVPEEYRRTH